MKKLRTRKTNKQTKSHNSTKRPVLRKMFGFTVAEKEHCYLENEPRGRAEIMGAAGRGRGSALDSSQKAKQSRAQAEPPCKGPWNHFYQYPSIIKESLVDSAVAVSVCSKSQLCPAAAKQRERGNTVPLPGGCVDVHQPCI